MFEETDQPVVVDRIKERTNVGINDPVHSSVANSDPERIQRIVLTAARAKTVRKADEFLFVNYVEDLDHRPLDNLVFD